MELLTEEIEAQLRENGRRQELVRGTNDEIDFEPVVKLFTPDAASSWLLTEIDPNDPTKRSQPMPSKLVASGTSKHEERCKRPYHHGPL